MSREYVEPANPDLFTINDIKPLYDAFERRIDVALLGEDEVLADDTILAQYAPKRAGMDDEDYKAFLQGATFPEAPQRTLSGLRGRALHNDPTIMRDGSPVGTETDEDLALRDALDKLDSKGKSFLELIEWYVEQTLARGGAGLSVGLRDDQDEGVRFVRHARRDLLDWEIGDNGFTYVVLDQSRTEIEDGGDFAFNRKLIEGAIAYTMRGENSVHVLRTNNDGGTTTVVSDLRVRDGLSKEIPFYFAGDPNVCKSMLLGLVRLSYKLFDTSGKYNWLEDKVSNPQFAVMWDSDQKEPTKAMEFVENAISDDTGKFRMGKQNVLPLWGAKAAFIEANPAGLSFLQGNMDRITDHMIALGARALADQTRVQLATDTVRMQNSAEGTLLSDVVRTAASPVNKALLYAAQLDPIFEGIQVKMSKTFFDEVPDYTAIAQLSTSWVNESTPTSSLHRAHVEAGLFDGDLAAFERELVSRRGAGFMGG